MSDLYKLSAMDMVSKLKSGDISPTQALDASYARIEEVEADIHALPILCKERAYAAAKALEENQAQSDSRQNDPAWLAGLPIAIKDLSDVAGVRTTYGSQIFKDHVPETSDILVEKLETNGAIVIGKSNSPEFGAGGNSFNDVFESTRTPWDTGMTSGGSSGGAASALASGEVWLATGSDLGGSLRTPASFCGIVGLRTSPSRLASGPSPMPFGTHAVHGPMGRDVGDTALFLDAMVGDHISAPLALPVPNIPFQQALGEAPRKRRVAFSADLGLFPIDPEIAAICESAANKLADHGWDVVDDIPDFSNAMDVFHAFRAADFYAGLGETLKQHRDLLKPEVIWNIEKGMNQTVHTLAQAERDRGALYNAMVEFFKNHDLLLVPSACTPPFPVDIRYLENLGDHQFSDYMEWLSLPSAITPTASPVLSLPCGMTKNGLPVGMQFIAPNCCEYELIAAANEAEQIMAMTTKVPMNPVNHR